MTGLAIAGVVISLLLLAAHFLRAGWPLLALVLVGAPLLLAVRRRWAARTLQVVLLLGALEWVRTLISLVIARLRGGEPLLRMTLILAAVIAVAVATAFALPGRHSGGED